MIDLAPRWTSDSVRLRKSFHETWKLKFSDPSTGHACQLQFLILSSANGFKKIAEVWFTHFERTSGGEIIKTALKQTFDIQAFTSNQSLRISDCELGPQFTCGSIQSKGRTVSWNLTMKTEQEQSFNFVPRVLTKFHLTGKQNDTIAENIRFSGQLSINDRIIPIKETSGMINHQAGPALDDSWVCGHCNTFRDQNGNDARVVFDGRNVQPRFGETLKTPRLSSFFFFYDGEEYQFNSLWNAVFCRSSNSVNDWTFRAEKGELSFRGHVQSEHRDFAGLTYENTDGSYVYCVNTPLANMTLLVYRHGKLETTLQSDSAALEIATRTKNPYVPLQF